MKKTPSSPVAELAAGVGNAAHQVIWAYRLGGEWIGELAAARWDKAFKESSPKLSAETRENATHARDVFGGYYSRGLALSVGGAEAVVDTVVGATVAAAQRVSSYSRQATAA